MENRYIYHYCAHYQIASGSINYCDGIALMEKRIESGDDYTRIKKLIQPEHHEKLTILSLSFLGMEQA